MRCGLFGKLIAKRDFIALFAPKTFLAVWEPWMQGSIAASRDRLELLTAYLWVIDSAGSGGLSLAYL